MEIGNLVLEFVKVILSPQVIGGAVAIIFFRQFREDIKALMLRIATIRLPGGGELSTSQVERTSESSVSEKAEASVPPGEASVALPQNITLTPDEAKQISEIFQAERTRAYLWEYRYLNYFLVLNTQRVLDWLASLKERTTYLLYDSFWMPFIPSAAERKAIINALESHQLIQLTGGLVEVTPKGHEYIEWRGPLPSK
ncbi:MAG: hypothetical protein WC369_00240 [Dehalococcoidales bacterium]|jgi:hypothetical protein